MHPETATAPHRINLAERISRNMTNTASIKGKSTKFIQPRYRLNAICTEQFNTISTQQSWKRLAGMNTKHSWSKVDLAIDTWKTAGGS